MRLLFFAAMRLYIPVLLLLAGLLIFASCESHNNEESPQNTAADSSAYITDLEHGDFTGSWRTPPPYDAYERARLNVEEEAQGISGTLRYARSDTAGASETRPHRYFWDGQMQGNTALIELREENGNMIGQARLALMGSDMAVQLLEPAPNLPEIFVLRRENEAE